MTSHRVVWRGLAIAIVPLVSILVVSQRSDAQSLPKTGAGGRIQQIGKPVAVQPVPVVRPSIRPGDLLVEAGGRILRIDPQLGDRSVVSGFFPAADQIGGGPKWNRGTAGLAVAPNGDLWLSAYTESGLPAVFHINAADGQRTIVSAVKRDGSDDPQTKGSGPPFNIGPLAFDPSTGLYLAYDDSIYRVDPDTGDRKLFSHAQLRLSDQRPIVGSGLAIQSPKAIITKAGPKILLASGLGLLLIDSKGNRSSYSGNLRRGQGPRIEGFLKGLAVLPTTGDVYALSKWEKDVGKYVILSIARNGDRVEVLKTDVREPVGMVTAGQSLIIADKQGGPKNQPRIVSIDPKTGDVAELSNSVKGSGPTLTEVFGIAVVPDAAIAANGK